MEHFNTYINETYMVPKGLPKDWALGPFAVSFVYILWLCDIREMNVEAHLS